MREALDNFYNWFNWFTTGSTGTSTDFQLGGRRQEAGGRRQEAGDRRVHQFIKWVVVRGDSSQVVGYKVRDVMSIQRAKGTFPFNVP